MIYTVGRDMNNEDQKICKIADERLAEYTQRTRSGSEQVFYTGNDERDFDRFRKEGGGRGHHVKMHDKPDTIRLQPPERHYYAHLIDGEWWWVNGCAECNGRLRDWMTYKECEKHDVCRTCSTHRADIKETPWGGKNGWQCKTCHAAEREALRSERLQEVNSEEYDELDFMGCDEVKCPHCGTSHEPDEIIGGGEESCEVCGGSYSLEVEYSATYTTKVIGERVTA
jgi:hypothetical protein